MRHIRLYRDDGQKWYLLDDAEGFTASRALAGVFPARAWEDWAQATGLKREELGEDEEMVRLGAAA